MKKLAADQRGSVLIWTALFLGLFLTVAAVSMDFGFQRIQRARLQTASDAAALAATTQSDEYQDLTVNAKMWHQECLESDVRGNCKNLHQEWHYTTFTARRCLAKEAESCARRAVPPSWSYLNFSVGRRWAELHTDGSPEAAARTAFEANARRVAGASRPRITRVGRDAVVVDAQAEHRTGLLGLFGIRRLGESVTGGAVAKPR